MYIDVSSINSIENILLGDLISGFSVLMVYAKHLLYYFIAFEIILSGLGWALYQSNFAERLFFQLLKIGLILFIVENYTFILNSLLSSALIIGQRLGQHNAEQMLLNPGLIWQYGYNFSVSLLKLAALSDGFALPLIFTVLGFGILLVVGLFGIQIFIQVVSFYFVAAMSLLVMPLAAFSPLRDFFSQSIKSLLQASIRLMVQMLLVCAAVSVWSSMKLQTFNSDMNINTPLGFLFTGMIFVFASFYLPRLAEKVVGSIQWQSMSNGGASPQVSVSSMTPSVAGAAVSASASLTAMQQSAGLASATGSHTAQAAMLTPAQGNQSQYVAGIKEDFARKTSRDIGLKNPNQKSSYEKDRQHRENILQLKEAFQLLLKELKNDSFDKK